MAEKKSLKRQSSMSEDFSVFLHDPKNGTYCGTRTKEAWGKHGCVPLGPNLARPWLALSPPPLHSSRHGRRTRAFGHTLLCVELLFRWSGRQLPGILQGRRSCLREIGHHALKKIYTPPPCAPCGAFQHRGCAGIRLRRLPVPRMCRVAGKHTACMPTACQCRGEPFGRKKGRRNEGHFFHFLCYVIEDDPSAAPFSSPTAQHDSQRPQAASYIPLWAGHCSRRIRNVRDQPPPTPAPLTAAPLAVSNRAGKILGFYLIYYICISAFWAM